MIPLIEKPTISEGNVETKTITFIVEYLSDQRMQIFYKTKLWKFVLKRVEVFSLRSLDTKILSLLDEHSRSFQ